MEIDLSKLIWSVVNFLVLLAILRKFLYRPLLGMMERREKDIAGNLESADRASKESAHLKEEYEARLREARKEASDIVARGVKLGDETRSRIMEEARKQADEYMEKARHTITREKDKAIAELKAEVAGLAVAAAGRVIGKNLQPEDHRRLVQEFLEEAGEAQ